MSLKNTHTRLTGHPMEIAPVPGYAGTDVQRNRSADRRSSDDRFHIEAGRQRSAAEPGGT